MRDINTFKRHAKNKLIVMYLAILLPIILVTVFETVFENLQITSIVLRYVAFVLVEAWIIYKIVRYHLILGKPGYAEEMLTKLTDERNVFIKAKSLILAIKIILFINGVALICAAFISAIIFYCILAELVAFLIVYFFVTLYFKRTY